MTTKKCIIVKLSALIFAFNTDVALAVESESSSMFFPGWPLVALVVLLIVFRKKLFAEASVQVPEDEHKETPPPVKEAPPAAASKPATKVKTAEKEKPAAKAKAKPATKAKPAAKAKKPAAKAKSVNLVADADQCQASTAKGTRCKRTTSLETASVTLDGTKYQLTVCKQHNNDAIKPFSELIS